MTNLQEEILIKETWHDKEKVEDIIQCMKQDINTAVGSRDTVLMKFSKENLTDTVGVLLSNPYLDVNKGREDGTTALHLASQMGNVNVIKMLLSHPSLDPNKVNNNYMTTLMEASRDGKSEVVELLLRHPFIDVNKVNLKRKSALFFACEMGRHAVVRFILRCPATKTELYDDYNKIAEDYAWNYTDILNDFDNLARLQSSGHTCCSTDLKKGLQISAKHGDSEMTDAFLNCTGIDLNNGYGFDGTPLYIASRANKFAIVEKLLAHPELNVNKDVNGKNALLAATEEGHAEVVRVLLQHYDIDTNIERQGNKGNALFVASEIGHSEIVRQLLSQPQIEVNNRYNTDYCEDTTSLGCVSKRGYLNVVKILMRCPKTKIDNEKLVIFETLDESLSSIRNTLLKINHTCCFNANEGLIIAAITGDHRAIRGLGQCPNADINTIDAKGRTPLYLASLLGHTKATQEILNHENISFNKGREIDGLSPFSIASQKGHEEIMTLLTNYSYLKNDDVNIGWQGDYWTNLYGGYELGKYSTPISTSLDLSKGSKTSQVCY